MDQHEILKNQLMATFQAELEEHLGVLNMGLLNLEAGNAADDPASLLGDMFRAAHSIKGAARAVDLWDIESLSHSLEDVFGAVVHGELSLAPEMYDVLFTVVDALRAAMAAHRAGKSLPLTRHDQLVAQINGLLAKDEAGNPPPAAGFSAGGDGQHAVPQTTPSRAAAGPVVETDPPPAAAEPPGLPAPEALPDNDQPVRKLEESVRVSTDKLDTLIANTGELLVARMRAEQRLVELKVLQQKMTRWHKDWRKMRVLFQRVRRHAPQSGELARLFDFIARNEKNLSLTGADVNGLLRSSARDHRRLMLLTDDLQDDVRRVRMLAVDTLQDLFARMVRDLAREQRKEVAFRLEGGDTEIDRQVLELMKDPLTHLLRNAVGHGIEPPEQRVAVGKPRQGQILLRAAQRGNTIVLQVADDGGGIDPENVRAAALRWGLAPEVVAAMPPHELHNLIFQPGFSTQPAADNISGRGIGLDITRQNLEKLHGLVQVQTTPGQGTTFTLTMPLTVATAHVLLLEAAGQVMAVPTISVERILRVMPAGVGVIEGRAAIRLNDVPLRLESLARLLQLPAPDPASADGRMLVVVLALLDKRVAVTVDRLHGTQEVVVKSLGPQLRRVKNISGATILGSGQVVMILNIADLMKTIQLGSGLNQPLQPDATPVKRKRVLVVDDSITTRTLEKNILENAGYEVQVAADGEHAWALIQSHQFSVVVSDISMPHMNGFELTEKVKNSDKYRDLPLVLVTSLESTQDRIKGLEAGADAYITKGAFDQRELLETIERLVE